MNTKNYSQPQLLEIGDAVQATLLLFSRGYVRDNRFIRRYWLPQV